ncbi:hypothetical protein MKW98_031994 [Papaver atlanticum]|uniref:F-box associated beta-propeller type 3 domain-containing protein n=1 Tax=Papaver atlanticum TaxID=357466 RepID=A0AAD4SGA0_9MAGN|nr:hypothetical protein MKW98_031994 [Papaver atlanticum]
MKLKKKKQRTEEGEGGDSIQIDGSDDDFQISLPIELILEFVSRLPIESLRRLSCTMLYVNSVPTGNSPVLYKNLFYDTDFVYDRNDSLDVNVRSTITYRGEGGFFGYSNGLSCFTKAYKKTAFVIDVWNFTTNELLRIIPPVMVDKEDTSPTRGLGYHNEYKLVLIVFIRKTRCRQGFVYTYGTKSCWKEIKLPEQRATSLQGTFIPCGGGGALFWMTLDPRIILQFDLHQDKFQYIRIPLERNEYPTSKNHFRLFEFKGFLGVAILLWRSNTTTTLEKVHLKMYKDNQVWVNETFDVSLCSIPFTASFRFFGFSDQVLLHWMDPNCFQFFNLHTKCLKVVRKLASGIHENRLPQRARDEDYWLYQEVRNISSLATLQPERAQKSDFKSVCSMMVKCIEDVFLVQQPKTLGVLASYWETCNIVLCGTSFLFFWCSTHSTVMLLMLLITDNVAISISELLDLLSKPSLSSLSSIPLLVPGKKIDMGTEVTSGQGSLLFCGIMQKLHLRRLACKAFKL